MAAPTHEGLMRHHPPINADMIDENTYEIWAITSHVIVKKGDDIQNILYQLAIGELPSTHGEDINMSISYTDFTKIK